MFSQVSGALLGRKGNMKVLRQKQVSKVIYQYIFSHKYWSYFCCLSVCQSVYYCLKWLSVHGIYNFGVTTLECEWPEMFQSNYFLSFVVLWVAKLISLLSITIATRVVTNKKNKKTFNDGVPTTTSTRNRYKKAFVIKNKRHKLEF